MTGKTGITAITSRQSFRFGNSSEDRAMRSALAKAASKHFGKKSTINQTFLLKAYLGAGLRAGGFYGKREAI